tara:strand:- start:261 stop:1010 length:750 start_codon:yes stop_codon:yes gene_type:complete
MKMIKKNTANSGLLGVFEKLIRVIPHIYLIFRPIIKFTGFFEEDFFYLKKIFYNKKINIIDIGASDGISALFFIRNLNPRKIYCYEPQKYFYKKLLNLKKKYKFLKLFNYGLGNKIHNEKVYYPYIKIFNQKLVLFAYSFPDKKELEKQITLDFLVKPKIYQDKIIVKKFKLPKDKIDLIKIDTNGSEFDIINSIIKLLKRDKPILIIENNNISKIYNKIKFLKYKKYYVKNDKLEKHTNQSNINIIFK